LLYRALFVFAALVMSMSACDAQEPPKAPKEQLLSDQTYAIETVTTLANAIAPDMPWNEQLFPETGCFGADGIVNGYQTSFVLDLRAEAVGHDINDVKIFEASRAWLAIMNSSGIPSTAMGRGKFEPSERARPTALAFRSKGILALLA